MPIKFIGIVHSQYRGIFNQCLLSEIRRLYYLYYLLLRYEPVCNRMQLRSKTFFRVSVHVGEVLGSTHAPI